MRTGFFCDCPHQNSMIWSVCACFRSSGAWLKQSHKTFWDRQYRGGNPITHSKTQLHDHNSHTQSCLPADTSIPLKELIVESSLFLVSHSYIRIYSYIIMTSSLCTKCDLHEKEAMMNNHYYNLRSSASINIENLSSLVPSRPRALREPGSEA